MGAGSPLSSEQLTDRRSYPPSDGLYGKAYGHRGDRVFEHYPEFFDEEMMGLIRSRELPFNFSGLKITRTSDEPKAINHIKGTVAVIVGSGMCTGRRVKHHLVNEITKQESMVLCVIRRWGR